ncbi:AAA family ATPase [Rhizobium binae]|uniref:AAA family ATPase n=1 Tax=Rhizobium binae TaxID=1138190 RepID=UPI001C8409F7|nr:AAA family ATPase [Rhizobium binae]MBX4967805.1 AAA family ATPase [Rhizobium binae]
MLRLTALHLDNFGPYKGRQTVTFPSEDGVTIIYGENMRGKTSLLNAIRFAFFGRILGRGRRDAALHLVGNWEEAKDRNVYGFDVRLDMTYDGIKYRLTRSFRPRPGIKTPEDDADYEQSHFLERDGIPLGPHQTKTELERILPEQISRFFLFDGELLQEYEDLLVAESDMGPKISEAIERILGLPLLTNSRDSLSAARERAEARYSRAAQGDQKTREFGNQLTSLQEERAVLVADLERQETELDELRKQKTALEEAMRKSQRLASLLDKRDGLERELVELRAKLQAKRSDIGSSMSTAWSALIVDKMKASLAHLRDRETQLQTALIRTAVLQSLSLEGQTTCPACLQPVSDSARQHVHDSLVQHGGLAGAAEEQELASIRRKIDALSKSVDAANPEALRLKWQAIEQDDRDIYSRQNEIKSLTSQIEGVNEDELRRTRSDFELTIRQISLLEQGLSDTRDSLQHNTNYRENIQRKLDRFAGSSFDVERKRSVLAADLEKMFTEGIEVFREQLRKRVEADATEHFRQLTSEADYAGLRINDSYGLSIVHKDGTGIPVRSAGAEHIVALSLVAALQNNAPLRGPIIIDSPFGRLDTIHTNKTVAAMPNMSRQVIVLVYEDELPPVRAREGLGKHLKAEWKLERRSARHTELVLRKD